MAQKVVTQLVDDIDGTVLEDGFGETVEFTLDGSSYEIDLAQEHAAQLHEAFGSYIAAGRQLSKFQGPRPSRRRHQITLRSFGLGGPRLGTIDWLRRSGHRTDPPQHPRGLRPALTPFTVGAERWVVRFLVPCGAPFPGWPADGSCGNVP